MNVKFKNKYNETLAGVLDHKSKGPVIVFVHGFTGDKDESQGLFSKAAEYFATRKLNTFRFDMSGCGESEGEFIDSTLEKQAKDLDSALEFLLLNHNPPKIGIVGFSLGATASMLLGPNVDAYSFWSPAFFPCTDMYPRYNTPEIRMQIQERGYFKKNGKKVSRKMLEDLENCGLGDIISTIEKPVQVIHGKKDDLIRYRSSEHAIKNCFFKCKKRSFVLISGATHSYKNRPEFRPMVYQECADWFLKTLQ